MAHQSSLEWTVRSPTGEVYSFTNLTKWCRENEHLFEDMPYPTKMTKANRVAKGLSCESIWRGWEVVSRKIRSEIEP